MFNELIRSRYNVSVSELLVIDNIAAADVDPDFMAILSAMNDFCRPE